MERVSKCNSLRVFTDKNMQIARWIIMIHVHAHTGTAETFSAIIPKNN